MAAILSAMKLTLQALKLRGFGGFVPFSDLPVAEVPPGGGIYAVIRASARPRSSWRRARPGGASSVIRR